MRRGGWFNSKHVFFFETTMYLVHSRILESYILFHHTEQYKDVKCWDLVKLIPLTTLWKSVLRDTSFPFFCLCGEVCNHHQYILVPLPGTMLRCQDFTHHSFSSTVEMSTFWNIWNNILVLWWKWFWLHGHIESVLGTCTGPWTIPSKPLL